jgi:hypothetical protein
MQPSDPDNPINPLRATHQEEHLDDIERALKNWMPRPVRRRGARESPRS